MKVRVATAKIEYGFVDVDIPNDEWETKDTYRKKMNVARDYAKANIDKILWRNWKPHITFETYWENKEEVI